MGAALVTALTGFVGFEATVVFSEESRDPQRTVPRATYLAVVVTGLLYAASAWAMSVATELDQIVGRAQRDGTDLVFNLVSPYVARELVNLGELLFATSLFAAMLSFHNTVARYLFALGREGVLPAVLGRTSRHTGAPKVGSVVQSVLALAVVIGSARGGADPIVHLFFWVTVTGGLGVLILMTATSTAVVGFFARAPTGENAWRRLVAPGLASLALATVLVVTVDQFAVLLGVAGHSPWRWALPGWSGERAVTAAAGTADTPRAAHPRSRPVIC